MKNNIKFTGHLTSSLGSLIYVFTLFFGRGRIADFPLGFLEGLALVLLVTGIVCFCKSIAQQKKSAENSENTEE